MDNSPGDELESMVALGIGPALNHNWQRRNALLGVEMVSDPDDITPFRGLDIVRLRKLIDERFAPEWNGDGRPVTSEFVAFMSAWPEVTAHGYAIHPWREDYRITIEGLECDLTRVPEDRGDALRNAFVAFESAHEFFADGDELWAWWD